MKKAYKPQPRRVNFILMDGGVGDHMASLVAINYITKNYNWITPLLWVPDYLVAFSRHVLPSIVTVESYTNMEAKYNPALTTKTTKWDGITSPMKIHVLDYAFHKLCDENPTINHKNYLQIKPDSIDITAFLLPKKYIVITSGYTAKVREFPANEINTIVEYAKDKGYTTVFLGQTQTKTGGAHTIKGNFDEGLKLDAGINLLDKTSLLEAAKIMHASAAVLGVDNGLLHVAGCTQADIIGGFTTVSPEIRMPVRNNILGWRFHPITPNASLECRFCQQNTNFFYGHDYRDCYKQGKKTDKIACTQEMSAKSFIETLDVVLRLNR